MEKPYKVILSDQARAEVEKLVDDGSEQDLNNLKNAFEELAKNPFGEKSQRFNVGLDQKTREALAPLIGQEIIYYKYDKLGENNLFLQIEKKSKDFFLLKKKKKQKALLMIIKHDNENGVKNK